MKSQNTALSIFHSCQIIIKFLPCGNSESLFVLNVNSFKWQNSLWFSASSIRQQHWLRERGRQVTLRSETDFMLLLSLTGTFFLRPEDFCRWRRHNLPCNVLVPQFYIHKSMSYPVAACSFSLIPLKETTCRIMPVCFQEDDVLTLILRSKYLFGATLFIYPALFFFLNQWEQSTSSFPCWEMMAGFVSKLSNQKKFWVLVSMQGHTLIFAFSLFSHSGWFFLINLQSSSTPMS